MIKQTKLNKTRLEMSSNDLTSKKTYVDGLFNEVGSFGFFHLKQILKMLTIATLPTMTIYVTIFNLADQKIECNDNELNQQKVNASLVSFLI